MKIGLYYECLCPYSVEYVNNLLEFSKIKLSFLSFVVDQLYPNWEYFGNEMLSVDLKPFGKANVKSSLKTLLLSTT